MTTTAATTAAWERDEDHRARLCRLLDTACWGWALDHVGRDSEEAELLKLLRTSIKRAHRLLGRPDNAKRTTAARQLLDDIQLGFTELMIVRPDALLALGVSLADV